MAAVKFLMGSKSNFAAIQSKDESYVYFVDLGDGQYAVYKGDKLYGTSRLASSEESGLLSASDKAALDKILSSATGGILPSYKVTKKSSPNTGAAVSYEFIKSDGAEGTTESVVGTIDVPQDKVIESGEVKYYTSSDTAVKAALPLIEVGDAYIDLTIANDAGNHIYILAKDLVDVYTGGDGIGISSNSVSVEINEDDANGLEVDGDGLKLNTATADAAGAISAEDKQKLDNVPLVFQHVKYEVKDDSITDVVYKDGEIRVLYASSISWASETNHTATFYAYAPEGAKSYRATIGESKNVPITSGAATVLSFTDDLGRKCVQETLQVVNNGSYVGAASKETDYKGWYFVVDWYSDAAGTKIMYSDTVRVNLSNESCHNTPFPYYLGEYFAWNIVKPAD